MEPLEATLVDELLLDFSGDPPTRPSLRRHRDPEAPPPETALVEEDLEWLSNKDAFPTLDTSDLSTARKPPTPPSAAGTAPLPTAAASSFFSRAPGRARSKGRRRRRQVQPPALLWPAEELAAGQGKRRCWHCEAEETPQWRAGPGGPKTLCNACGVRYKSGRLVPEYRPANSPTFSGELHSNSHRKVMEMRRRKEGLVPPVVAAVAPAPAKEVKKKKRKKRQRVSFARILSVQISAGNTLQWK